jgi:reactive chlorine resistance protein C
MAAPILEQCQPAAYCTGQYNIVPASAMAINSERNGTPDPMTNNENTQAINTRLTLAARTRIGSIAGRYGLVIVLAWFGAMKFTYYEAQGISPLIANSPVMSWIYHVISISAFGRFLGTAELITAVLLALKPWSPKLSVLGGALAVVFFIGTLSFMVTTPDIGEASAGGFPVLSATGEFLMKDIALLGLSVWVLTDSIDAAIGGRRGASGGPAA